MENIHIECDDPLSIGRLHEELTKFLAANPEKADYEIYVATGAINLKAIYSVITDHKQQLIELA